MTQSAPRIFHIALSSGWDPSASAYRGDTLAAEGFIHCSEAHQVMPVASAIFAGRTDLLLLEIDPARVRPEIRHENLDGGEQTFPHIYGPLNRDAVLDVHPLRADASGGFVAPAVLSRRS